MKPKRHTNGSPGKAYSDGFAAGFAAGYTKGRDERAAEVSKLKAALDKALAENLAMRDHPEDWELGRMIRVHGISVMRVEGGDEWSACDSQMQEDFGHNGTWREGATPLEAAKSVLRSNGQPLQ